MGGAGPDAVIVVSGLPRSGTSMMMQMLEAGGVPVLTDGVREADEDNRRGYYELEEVKRSRRDVSWVAQAAGKAVKVVSMLLYELPEDRHYRVVFMRRDMDEVLASQRAMLKRRGEPDPGQASDLEIGAKFQAHLAEVDGWMEQRSNMEALHVEYADVLEDPTSWAQRIARFLGRDMDVEAMVKVVDGGLRRQRVGRQETR